MKGSADRILTTHVGRRISSVCDISASPLTADVEGDCPQVGLVVPRADVKHTYSGNRKAQTFR
jgi:hypothetical protein